MPPPPTRSQARLAHLVGPGPAAALEAPALSLAVVNPGPTAAAVRLELELAPAGGARLALGTWSGLVPAGARRELRARVAWSDGALELEQRRFAFAGAARGDAAIVARARLDGDVAPASALEVGLRAPTDGARA